MTRSLSLLIVLLIGLAGCSTLDRPSDRYADRYRSTRSYPSSAKTREGGQDRYRMCHNGRTATYPTPAVRAHLNHGDRFGACSRREDDRGHGDDRRRGRGRGH